MTSGSSYEEFVLTPEQEQAFKDLMRSSRTLQGWSQQQAAEKSGVAQTVISSLERGPYPGMRLWDIWRLCTIYGIDVVDVRKTLGWYNDEEERANSTATDIHLKQVLAGLRSLDRRVLDCILNNLEWTIAGVRSRE